MALVMAKAFPPAPWRNSQSSGGLWKLSSTCVGCPPDAGAIADDEVVDCTIIMATVPSMAVVEASAPPPAPCRNAYSSDGLPCGTCVRGEACARAEEGAGASAGAESRVSAEDGMIMATVPSMAELEASALPPAPCRKPGTRTVLVGWAGPHPLGALHHSCHITSCGHRRWPTWGFSSHAMDGCATVFDMNMAAESGRRDAERYGGQRHEQHGLDGAQHGVRIRPASTRGGGEED